MTSWAKRFNCTMNNIDVYTLWKMIPRELFQWKTGCFLKSLHGQSFTQNQRSKQATVVHQSVIQKRETSPHLGDDHGRSRLKNMENDSTNCNRCHQAGMVWPWNKCSVHLVELKYEGNELKMNSFIVLKGRRKKRIFYGQADRKGEGGGQPPWPWQ